jgi:hypothetical protein
LSELRVIEIKKESENRKRAIEEYESYEIIADDSGNFAVIKDDKQYTGRIVKNSAGYMFYCDCKAWKHSSKKEPCKHGYMVLRYLFESGMNVPRLEVERQEFKPASEWRGKQKQSKEEIVVTGGQILEVQEIEEAKEIDEDQIIADLEGRVVEDYVISIAGKPALSYAGILKVVRMQGGFEVLELEQLERTDKLCIYRAKVRDSKTGNVAIAIGKVDLEREKQRMEEKKKKEPDPAKHKRWEEAYQNMVYFMEEIASSFAKRNAFKMLIDEREWAYKLADKLMGR